MSLSILWLARTLPLPLNSGDRIYTAKLVEAVASAGTSVVFVGLANPDEPMLDRGVLKPIVQWRLVPGTPRSRIPSLLSPLPMVGARFATHNYHSVIGKELAGHSYDAVVFDHYALDWALPDVKRLSRSRPVLVHVAHDFETDVTAQIAGNYSGDPIRKFLLRKNAAKTAQAERRLAQSCDLLACLTTHDRAGFLAINPALQTIVLPPGYSGAKQATRTLDPEVPRRVVIVGSFQWIAKQMNLERFMQAADGVFAKHGIELQIIGFVPPDVQARMSSQFPFARFRGFVDDLTGELQQARLALVPEETGGGFKLKTLDYIFSRVPVAAIENALNGIPEQLKSQFIVASDLQQLVARVVMSIDDNARLNAMQNKAFALAEGLFDWDTNGRQFVTALQAVRTAKNAA